MSAKNPIPPTPKYINDFTKALAAEVRILLDEVGKLRDERRQLQYEIAELMVVKSKHGAGGEYAPGWHPKPDELLALPEPGPPPPAIEDSPAAQARPGWRVVHKRADRKPRIQGKVAAAPPAALPPPPLPEPPRQEMPSWTQWRPNPLLMPTITPSPAIPAPGSPPPRSGLFGPSTPPPK